MFTLFTVFHCLASLHLSPNAEILRISRVWAFSGLKLFTDPENFFLIIVGVLSNLFGFFSFLVLLDSAVNTCFKEMLKINV